MTINAPAFICPETREELDSFAKRTRRAALDVLGRPPFDRPPPLNARVVSESDAGTYIRRNVRYGNESDDVVWAYLLVPKGLAKPTPAIICLAGSFMTPNWGKDAPVGLAGPLVRGDPEAYGEDLAKAGYVTLCPDYPCAGTRTSPGLKPYDTASLDERFPEWSRTGMSIWDVGRAVDFLLTVPEVDGSRIGCTGWSQGGATTVWGAAMDSRIAAAVSVCGWSPFRGQPADKVDNYLASYNYPRLRPYVESGRKVPFDMDQVAALIAPRPLLDLVSRQDRNFPNMDELTEAERELSRLYEWLEAAERFKAVYYDGDHVFKDVAARETLGWFDRWLRKEED